MLRQVEPEPSVLITGPPRLTLPLVAALAAATRKVSGFVFVGLVPLAFGVLAIYGEAKLGLLGFDFKGTIWHPGREILAGHSPYPAPIASELDSGNPSVYPPVALLLTLPYALLPLAAAYWAWIATLVAAVVVTLRLLGVRDWRCYAIALGSCPVVFGFALGNLVVLLVPIAAYAWRYRDNPRRTGLAVGLGIALKLVLWPLLIWFVASRRWRAAFVAASSAVLSLVGAWAVLGFDGLRDYPKLLSVNNDVYSSHSWSLLAGGVGLGLPSSVAGALASLVGVALLAYAFVLIRGRDGDSRAFCVVIVASLALLPVVWPASLVLLLVPVAILRPSANRVWMVFYALWLGAVVPHAFADVGTPQAGVPLIVWKMQHSGPPTGQIAAFTLVVGLMTVMLLRPGAASAWSR
jgi:hypothetical protein